MTVPKFSVYMPVINQPILTELTLRSFFKNLTVPFHKFIVISCAANNPQTHRLMAQLAHEGYGNIPGEKFTVINLSEQEMLGTPESFNMALQLLDDDEDFFYIPNNMLFGPRFLEPILRAAYDNPMSSDIYMIHGHNILSTELFNVRAMYENSVREQFIENKIETADQGEYQIQEFFRLYGPGIGRTFDETTELLTRRYRDQVVDGEAENFYIKRICLDSVGFFDERFARDQQGKPSGGGEDYDYVIRIRAVGKRAVIASDSLMLKIAYGATSRYLGDGRAENLQIQMSQKYGAKGSWQEKSLIQPGEDYVLVGGKKLPLYHSIQSLRKVPL